MHNNTPFINIHCHKNTSDGISIQNLDQRDFELKSTLPEHFSIGLHPWFLDKETLIDYALHLDDIINKYKPLAIGECGLDKTIDIDWDLQLKAFLVQVSFSEKYKLPLIIHCVRAYNEILNYKKVMKPKMPWIIHGFNKKNSILKELIRNDFYISLGHAITQKEKWTKEIAEIIPREKLFFETDDNDISIEDIYLAYNKYSRIPMDNLKNQISSNYKNVFYGK